MPKAFYGYYISARLPPDSDCLLNDWELNSGCHVRFNDMLPCAGDPSSNTPSPPDRLIAYRLDGGCNSCYYYSWAAALWPPNSWCYYRVECKFGATLAIPPPQPKSRLEQPFRDYPCLKWPDLPITLRNTAPQYSCHDPWQSRNPPSIGVFIALLAISGVPYKNVHTVKMMTFRRLMIIS